METLEVVGEKLAAGTLRPPRSLAVYLVRAMRNLSIDRERENAARGRELREAATEAAAGGERVMPGSCSEHSVRESRGPGHEDAPLSLVLQRLVSTIDEGLSEDERLILYALGQYLPQRVIAEWLGVSYAAATQRIWRLRERLREEILRIASSLRGAEQRELLGYFRRWEVLYEPPGLAPSERGRERSHGEDDPAPDPDAPPTREEMDQ
jgi:DNA-directed RNA polymerase specialized sigma24 family protein